MLYDWYWKIVNTKGLNVNVPGTLNRDSGELQWLKVVKRNIRHKKERKTKTVEYVENIYLRIFRVKKTFENIFSQSGGGVQLKKDCETHRN